LPDLVRSSDHLGYQKGFNSPVFLTFDDGPDPYYTEKILDLLKRYQIVASFFVIGKAAEKFPDLLIKIRDQGHSIGNHSYSHHHPWFISSTHARDEVQRTSKIIQDITGILPRWFRPPFGRLSTAMQAQASINHMTTVLWNHSIIDWGLFATKSGIGRRFSAVKPGDVVLMHDGKAKRNHPEIMIEFLPVFLRSLREQSLVTLALDACSPDRIIHR
jgi:peptidoglycan-N-acetylglucosamine deacetylase